MTKNKIGQTVFVANRYPLDPKKPLVERRIIGHSATGLEFDYPVIWSKDRIRGTKEDGFDANEIYNVANLSSVGRTDQDYVPKGMIIP
jgi:hypothetical protein